MNSLADLGNLRRAEIAAALTALSIALGGCTSGLGLWPVAQSHFTATPRLPPS